MTAYPLWMRPADLAAPRSMNVTVSGNCAATATQGAARFLMPVRGKVVKVAAVVGTAPATTAILVDCNVNGTTVFTTQGNRASIAADATESTLGVPDADDACTFSAGDVITVDLDQVGTGTVGADITIRVDWIPV